MPKVPVTMDRIRTTARDVGVYLPLGVYARARDQITDLNRACIQKTFKGLIDRGQERVRPLEGHIRQRAGRVETDIRSTATTTRKTVKKTAARAKATATKTSGRAKTVARTTAPKMPRVAAPRSASELPITHYGSLTVEEITKQLVGLTQTDLAKVYKYERAHHNRSTILEAIDGKLIDLPIATYDALTVEEINKRLESLSEAELRTLRRYESGTKARATVIEKIDSLLA